ncbi:FtsX-like permease family protein [uncultured Ilyobacter sp.]|uniref:ABC transporter permease n=1 Tax=uncultured Ilyobacter sp. TaxID=544433 RepID=UPI002AA72CDB|nr:FtsX-like permease family protein [uncultured Ilyobacter sp.]
MCFWMAWKMIWENKKRSLFSLAGVFMGISSIIMIFSLAEGGKELIKSDLSSLAENRIMIGGENLSVRDGKIIEDIPFVKYAFFPDAKRDIGELILTGYSKKSLLAMGYPSNLKNREILLEENTSKKLYGGADPSGKDIELGDRKEKYIIRGVYKEKNPLESANDNETGITSLISLERMTGLNRFSKVVVSFYEEEDGEKLAPLIIDRLKKAHGGRGNYIIMENSGKYKKVEKIKNTLNIFLAAIGLVALIMGGLGISNLMAAMVRERTPHIGILRAMGAGKNFIMTTFLIEAASISVTGGIIGIMAGITGSKVIGKLIEVPPIFMGRHIVMTLVVSGLLGVAFGILPAKKAADMDTVEALRAS